MTSSRRHLLSAMHLGGLTFREVCLRTWTKINEHEILTRAAAISFYALAALVPFLALVITLSAWFLLSGTWETWVTPNRHPWVRPRHPGIQGSRHPGIQGRVAPGITPWSSHRS
ncbi:MAG TPA: hypothetical protein VN648_00040, partial [Candidatus Methylomirabilis sp.]|nr:hypothetical protein [Candidatus Methylomirabilis sp.]